MADFKTLFGKYIYILTCVSLLGGGGLFAYLQEQGLEIVCEDKICQANVECSIDCSVYNPDYQSKYLYNYGNWSVVFSPDIVDADIYAKYYGKWRYTNFTKATRFPNIKEDAKYVFVFPSRTTKYFQVRVTVSEPAVIKWDFGPLDPMIVSWDYTYENKSRQVKVYEDELVIVEPQYFSKNNSWSVGYNYTMKKFSGYKTEYYQSDKSGVKIGSKTIINPNVNVNDDTLVEWTIPIGDRNLEEYGLCRSYEIQKGVCSETKITEVAKIEVI